MSCKESRGLVSSPPEGQRICTNVNDTGSGLLKLHRDENYRLSIIDMPKSLHGYFMLHIHIMLPYNRGSPKDAFSAYSTQSSQLCNSICFLFRKRVLNCENWAPSQSLGATILWPHHGHADPAGVAVRCHHGLGRIKIGHISVTNPRSGSRTPVVPGMPGHRMHHRMPLPGFVIQHRQVHPASRCPPKAIGVSLMPPFPWPAWA